jgi:hypothetical protein
MAYGANGQILSSAEAQGRNTNSIMQGWIDRGPWYYWDTVIQVPAGGPPAVAVLQQQYTPFTIPIGGQNPNLPVGFGSTNNSKLITNMKSSGLFNPPRCLLLEQIGIYVSSRMIKSDIDLVLDSCYFEFRIDDKIFHEGHLYEYGDGGGLQGTTTQNAESVYTNGSVIPVFQKRFADWSKYIAPLQQFSFNIFFPGNPAMGLSGPPTLTGPAGLYMMIRLDGLTDRSVQ